LRGSVRVTSAHRPFAVKCALVEIEAVAAV